MGYHIVVMYCCNSTFLLAYYNHTAPRMCFPIPIPEGGTFLCYTTYSLESATSTQSRLRSVTDTDVLTAENYI